MRQWKGLCHLFGFMHKCHPSPWKSLFPHPKITILDRDRIVNKYPKNTQKRSWLFFPSMTSKQVSHSNKQEKNLINISFLLVIHISMLLVFWQLHLKVLKISKLKKPHTQIISYFFFKDINKKISISVISLVITAHLFWKQNSFFKEQSSLLGKEKQIMKSSMWSILHRHGSENIYA